jgi:anhydro-N-acetylmuramic acid kinase
MLIDALVRMRTGGAAAMDKDGALALRGSINFPALRAMLANPYFATPPPKSTGRERFGPQFLATHAAQLDGLSLEDGAATLTELTARAAADAIEAHASNGARVLCSGGGARNPALLARLRNHLPESNVESSDAYGLPGDAKEAIAFAILGYETLRERAANVPRVTGATREVVLGSIVPRGLRGLIAEVESECQSL